MSRITWLVLVLFSLTTLGFMLHAARPLREELTAWVVLLGFACWALSPYGGLARLVGRVRGRVHLCWLVLAVSVLVGVSATSLQYQAFIWQLDPQSGLLFLFLPLFQWLAVGLSFLLVR